MTTPTKIVVDLTTGEQSIVPLTAEEIAQAEAANAAWEAEQAAYVPLSVPLWAVRTILQNENLLTQAQAAIDASTDNALKNVWEYGNYADRNSAAIASLGAALNLTSAQIDQMFRDANKLTV